MFLGAKEKIRNRGEGPYPRLIPSTTWGSLSTPRIDPWERVRKLWVELDVIQKTQNLEIKILLKNFVYEKFVYLKPVGLNKKVFDPS